MAKGIPFAHHIRPDGSVLPANLMRRIPVPTPSPRSAISFSCPCRGSDATGRSTATRCSPVDVRGRARPTGRRKRSCAPLRLPAAAEGLADATLAVLDKVREPPPAESPPEVTFEAPPGTAASWAATRSWAAEISARPASTTDPSTRPQRPNAVIANGAAVASRRAEAARRLALPQRLRAAAARLVLPLLAGLGLFCLLFGPFLQFRARLRR